MSLISAKSYFFERLVSVNAASTHNYTVINHAVLTLGGHTPRELCAELKTQMDVLSFFGSSTYTVSFAISLDPATSTLKFICDTYYAN